MFNRNAAPSQALLRRPEVTGEDFDSHRTSLRAAEQGDHHLFVTAFAIAIIAKRDDITLGVAPSK